MLRYLTCVLKDLSDSFPANNKLRWHRPPDCFWDVFLWTRNISHNDCFCRITSQFLWHRDFLQLKTVFFYEDLCQLSDRNVGIMNFLAVYTTDKGRVVLLNFLTLFFRLTCLILRFFPVGKFAFISKVYFIFYFNVRTCLSLIFCVIIFFIISFWCCNTFLMIGNSSVDGAGYLSDCVESSYGLIMIDF